MSKLWTQIYLFLFKSNLNRIYGDRIDISDLTQFNFDS